MDKQEVYDITIIGGGPVGLFAAFYAGLRNAKTKILESLPELGGQLATLYPEKIIYDVAGFPEIKSQDLVTNLIAQLDRFKETTNICCNEEVQQIEKHDDYFILTTSQGIHYSKTILITAGNGAFQPRRLDLPGAAQYEDKQLHYFIKNLQAFAGKTIAITGGGDTAVDWALSLEPIAKEVFLIHRRPKFRAQEYSVSQLENSAVKIKTPFVIDALSQQDKRLNIHLKEIRADKNISLDIDDLIVSFGFISSLGPISEWGLTLDHGKIMVDTQMRTNIPGIYAAGDICTYNGKIELIVTGFGEGPTAINNAMHYIDPQARVQPMRSTSMFPNEH